MATNRKLKYEEISLEIYKKGTENGPMDSDRAKELLGWQDEHDEGVTELYKPGTFATKDKEGHKIRFINNAQNRPWRAGLADRYCNELLRRKWRLNGETIVIDETGCVQSGQHRLAGLILAEQTRKLNPDGYRDYGSGPITMECIVVYGVSSKNEVVDTIDLGQKRSLGDVLFRNRQFDDVSDREQQQLSNELAGAARLVWLRQGGKVVSDAPNFPHSEALDFIEMHPRLLDAVKFIDLRDEKGTEGKKIRAFISKPYAAALMYLMATSKTNAEKFDSEGTVALNYDLWQRAETFWTLFAAGTGFEKGDPILVLRSYLHNLSASGSSERDNKVCAVILAWNAWLEQATVGVKDITPKRDEKKVIMSYLGGLDQFREKVVVEDPEPEEVEETNGKAPKAGKKAAGKKAAAPKAAPKAVAPKANGKAAPVAKTPVKKKINPGFKVGDRVSVVWNDTARADENYRAVVSSIDNDGEVHMYVPSNDPDFAEGKCNANLREAKFSIVEALPPV